MTLYVDGNIRIVRDLDKLERHLGDHLMAEIIELSEVHVTPHLRSLLSN